MADSNKELLKICTGCGEIFHANVEAEAAHHSQAGQHVPLLPWRKQRRRPPIIFARAA